jgi:glycosyltransferase involved in cell wall biosynthesis
VPAKILFIGPHRPNRNASQRFRMEQFFPYLEQAGFECDYSWFIDAEDDRIFYSKGNGWGKLKIYLKAIRVRLNDVLRANRYDVIFIQREAFMTRSVFFERKFSRSKARVVFDFDDAIWLENVSAANKKVSWMKRPGKITDIIKMSDAVIAGNSFLAEYARRFNVNVHIIPTVIDTSVYLPSLKNKTTELPVCIGWIGSSTTVKYFETMVPVLKKIKAKYGEQVRFKLIGDKNFTVNDVPIDFIQWHFEKEVTDLQALDIGVMPLPDNEWSRGKCGFKALQYMALQIPPVISPVGMNAEIVQHGENGFLASTEEEWMEYLSQLVESPALRKEMGIRARQTVIEKYSVKAQLSSLISILSD